MPTAVDLPPVDVFGYPGDLGGANTELWHTLKLWRRHGLAVRLVHLYGQPPPDMLARCDAIGCETRVVFNRNEVAEMIDGPRVVVAFCNRNAIECADLVRQAGGRVVWVGCMNYLDPAELRHYRMFGAFDAYVFQSVFQRDKLGRELTAWGARPGQFYRIPGYLDADEFVYKPRPLEKHDPFTIGRLSRGDPAKFSPHTWRIFSLIRRQPKRLRILGWAPAVAAAIGSPPAHPGGPVELLPEREETAGDFLATLHAYGQFNNAAVENWPRVALECFAAGVPIVAQAVGGWPEMIRHGETGYLVGPDDPEAAAHFLEHLGRNDDDRYRVARSARDALAELTDPAQIWPAWARLFEDLAP